MFEYACPGLINRDRAYATRLESPEKSLFIPQSDDGVDVSGAASRNEAGGQGH
jgi:hypothetical protein